MLRGNSSFQGWGGPGTGFPDGFSMPGNVQNHPGWSLEQPEIVESVSVCTGEVGIKLSLRSLKIQTMLCFYDSKT